MRPTAGRHGTFTTRLGVRIVVLLSFCLGGFLGAWIPILVAQRLHLDLLGAAYVPIILGMGAGLLLGGLGGLRIASRLFRLPPADVDRMMH